MTEILIAIAVIETVIIVWLAVCLFRTQIAHSAEREAFFTEREALIRANHAELEEQAEKFAEERKQLYDKILLKNGFSPVGEKTKTPESQPIESTLNRNARLYHEQNSRPKIEVK